MTRLDPDTDSPPLIRIHQWRMSITGKYRDMLLQLAAGNDDKYSTIAKKLIRKRYRELNNEQQAGKLSPLPIRGGVFQKAEEDFDQLMWIAKATDSSLPAVIRLLIKTEHEKNAAEALSNSQSAAQ